MANFSDEDLARMTPAEREAVTADDDDSDMQTIANETGGDDGDAAGAGSGKPADKDVTDVTDKNESRNTSQDDNSPTAAYVTSGVDNYDEQVSTLETKKDDAFKKMMDGEITDAEYRTIDKEVSSELRALDRAMTKAEVSNEMTNQQATTAWLDYVDAQIQTSAKAGADLSANEALMAELDRTVKLLAGQVRTDPDMVKHLSPTKPGALITNVDKWVLNEAIEIVKARNKMTAAPGKGDTTPPKSRAGTPPDLSGLPPNLARVPAAKDADAGGDEFAHLANLTGTDYEKALAKLSPDQIERFMG